MGKAIVMIHGRGGQPDRETLLACWRNFLDPAIVAGATLDMVDYVTLWGYNPPVQTAAEAGCEKEAVTTTGNPDVATQAVFKTIAAALNAGTHLPFANVLLGWPDLEALKDKAVEELWRNIAADTGNQFVIDVLNFFLDKPEIRTGARQQLIDAINNARAGGNDVLVLAHSFGTIVAYEAALQYQEQAIDTLVTFGSPLAWCYDIWGKAAPQPNTYGRPKVFPHRGLQHWVNVYDGLDPVATGVVIAGVPHLAAHYLSQGKQVVVDAGIANPYAKDDDLGSHHDWRGYLACDPVAQALQQFVAT